MDVIEFFFEGYCPESLLKGERIEMKLNQDDFWESVQTGLQVSVFPPYAAILNWRGTGKFRASSGVASDELNGLVLTQSSTEAGREIFPDEQRILGNKTLLKKYIVTISAKR